MDMRQRIISVIESNPDLSVRKASLAAGLSDSMLHKFLNGQTDSMTIKSAEKLADSLGVDARWLIFGEGERDQATDIGAIFERIPAEQRAQAQRILETFARTGTDG